MKIELNDFFKNSFYITIDYSRKRRFDDVFSKCFSFDGYDFPHVFWGYYNNDLESTYKCELSHASIIKMAKSLNLPFVAIFEDDAYPCKFVERKMKSLISSIPDDSNILILGYNEFQSVEHVDENVSRLKGYLWGSHAYVIFNRGYNEYLIKYNENPKIVSDDFFERMTNVYVSNENLFIQMNDVKSMNDYVGYIYDNTGHDSPPDNFDSLNRITSHVDSDKKLISSIGKLGKFLYRMNGGNAGDFVISSSEFNFFDKNNFNYELITDKNKKNLISKKFSLVYGGGGGWVDCYHDYYQRPLIDFFKNKNLEKCVILPSTFYKCDDVLNCFDERFTVFCRDENSYNYCISRNKRASFYMHDDMALSIDIDFFLKRDFLNTKYERVKNSISSVSEILNGNISDELTLIRNDVEKSIPCTSKNFDLSSIFSAWGENVMKEESFDAASVFINSVNKFNNVVTNRLHVLIIAHLLGKNITAYDNSYGKVSSVYKMSLKNDSNIITKFSF